MYQKLEGLLREGAEEEARRFITEHINEFPEEDRNDIIFTLFEEGLLKVAQEREAIDQVQQEGLEMAQALKEARRKAQDKLKVIGLEERLGK